MGRAATISLMTGPECRAWDADQTPCHGYARGEVFALDRVDLRITPEAPWAEVPAC